MGTRAHGRPQSAPTGLLAEMVELSRRFGADPEFVRAGGGNASAKADGVLYIKPSGVPLATLSEESLIALAIEPLLEVLEGDPGSGSTPGSDQVMRAAEAARLSPDDGRRPSVELLFHALLPEPIVLHTHPTVINALTCCRGAGALAHRVVGDHALWVAYTDPGLPLARAIRDARSGHVARTGEPAPRTLLLQNHGLIVAGDTVSEIDAVSHAIAARIAARIAGHKGEGPLDPWGAVERIDSVLRDVTVDALRSALGGLLGDGDAGRRAVALFDDSALALGAAGSELGRQFARGGPLTPDQIVYAGSLPLLVESAPADGRAAVTALERALTRRARAGVEPPIIVLVAGLGLFAVGDSERQADTARQLYLDAMRIAVGAHRLGGVRPLAPAERQFIERWEAEAYRRQVASTPG